MVGNKGRVHTGHTGEKGEDCGPLDGSSDGSQGRGLHPRFSFHVLTSTEDSEWESRRNSSRGPTSRDLGSIVDLYQESGRWVSGRVVNSDSRG